MNEDQVGQMVGNALIIGAMVATWVESRKAKKEAEKATAEASAAGASAESAVTLSKPTGNGFAKRVEDQLAAILEQQEETNRRMTIVEEVATRTEGKVDRHVEAHATADVQNRRRL